MLENCLRNEKLLPESLPYGRDDVTFEGLGSIDQPLQFKVNVGVCFELLLLSDLRLFFV